MMPMLESRPRNAPFPKGGALAHGPLPRPPTGRTGFAMHPGFSRGEGKPFPTILPGDAPPPGEPARHPFAFPTAY